MASAARQLALDQAVNALTDRAGQRIERRLGSAGESEG